MVCVAQRKERTTLNQVEAGRLFWNEYAFWVHREETVPVVGELSVGDRYDTTKAVLIPTRFAT